MASPSKRVLVTGSGGFTGRHLCAHLRDNGFDVVGLTDHAAPSTHELRADLTDALAMAGAVRAAAPDYVVHLAAIAFPGHTQAADVYRVNVDGTLNLLQALADSPFGRAGVLLPSTATVYAHAGTSLLREDSPLEPASHYAVSKLAMEHMARLFRASLPITIVRPFNYTGPGQREPYIVPKIVRHFVERAAVIELGNVDVEREFLDVRAIVDAYCRLLVEPRARGLTLNLCSGRGTTVRRVVEELTRITGHEIEIRVNPKFVRIGEPQRVIGSNEQVRGLIGDLVDIPLATTLRDMLGTTT